MRPANICCGNLYMNLTQEMIMHKKLTGLLSLSMLTVMSASAFADDGKWSVGASVLYQEQAYRGTKTSDKFMPVPMVNYEGKNFYFHTLATGYYLWNDKKISCPLTCSTIRRHTVPKIIKIPACANSITAVILPWPG